MNAIRRCSLNYSIIVQGNVTYGGSVIQVDDFIGQYDGVAYDDYEAMMSVLPEDAKFAFQISVHVDCTVAEGTHEITNASYTDFVALDGEGSDTTQELSWRDTFILKTLYQEAP